MATFEFILLILFAVLISAVVGQSLPRVSVPLVQIVFGLVLVLVAPSLANFSISSELFLLLFIAPLLFDESRRISTSSIWNNKASIASLAVGLVFVTLLVVGFVMHWIVPTLPLAAAFALGAALGPTDAVAVSSLSDEVKLSQRQKTLLSGEALLNDASGVVSFQFAIAAAVTGAFSLVDATVTFLLSFFGGLALGVILAIGYKLGMSFVRTRGLETTTVHVLSEVVTPFAIFLASEQLGVSGILAVVAAGLFLTAYPEVSNPTAARLNVVSGSVWEIIVFVINGAVFVLLGIELPVALSPTDYGNTLSLNTLLLCVVAVTLITIVMRFAWILVMEAMSRRTTAGRTMRLERALAARGLTPSSANQHAQMQHEMRIGSAVPTQTPLRDAIVTTLAGPKGAVTLSIAFTIPLMLDSGEWFPYRSALIFIASGVIIVTLLLANFVVPILAPKDTEDELESESHDMRIKVYKGVISELKARQTPETSPATSAVVRQYRDRIAHFREKDTSSKKLNELNSQLVARQQKVVEDCMRKGLTTKAAGTRFLKNLKTSRRLLVHGATAQQALRNPWRHPLTTLTIALRGIAKAISPRRPNPDADHEFRELAVKVEEASVLFLGEMVSRGDKETASAARLLLEEHESALASARARVDSSESTMTLMRRTLNPRMRSMGAKEYNLLVSHMQEVEAEGLRIELELISRMREEGTISRSVARELREEVYVMQMDLYS